MRKERKVDEGKRLHRWHDMGANRNHQRLQPMIDAMTPEKPLRVIHNRTIGGHVTLDRYLAWHVSTIVCLRSLISLELHHATRPAEKSTYTVYVVSEFEVLFRHVPWSQTPRYVSSTLKMLRGWLTHYFRCHSAVVFHVVRDCMCFFCMCFFCMCFFFVCVFGVFFRNQFNDWVYQHGFNIYFFQVLCPLPSLWSANKLVVILFS